MLHPLQAVLMPAKDRAGALHIAYLAVESTGPFRVGIAGTPPSTARPINRTLPYGAWGRWKSDEPAPLAGRRPASGEFRTPRRTGVGYQLRGFRAGSSTDILLK